MIQGGDLQSKNAPAGKMLGNGDVGYYVDAEFNPAIIHKKGALAAARDNNPAKKSSGCQFYIVQGRVYNDNELTNFEKQLGIKYTPEQRNIYKTIGGTPMLDMNYTVFGEVIEGLDNVDKIATVAKDGNDRPLEDVKMTIKAAADIK
jgi:peptidyl-prolyl cis-trans isomerase B (cyclophilin B)